MIYINSTGKIKLIQSNLWTLQRSSLHISQIFTCLNTLIVTIYDFLTVNTIYNSTFLSIIIIMQPSFLMGNVIFKHLKSFIKEKKKKDLSTQWTIRHSQQCSNCQSSHNVWHLHPTSPHHPNYLQSHVIRTGGQEIASWVPFDSIYFILKVTVNTTFSFYRLGCSLDVKHTYFKTTLKYYLFIIITSKGARGGKGRVLTVCPWNVLIGLSCPNLQTWMHISVLQEAKVLLLCQSTSNAGAEKEKRLSLHSFHMYWNLRALVLNYGWLDIKHADRNVNILLYTF